MYIYILSSQNDPQYVSSVLKALQRHDVFDPGCKRERDSLCGAVHNLQPGRFRTPHTLRCHQTWQAGQIH